MAYMINTPENAPAYEVIYTTFTPKETALYAHAADVVGGVVLRIFNMETEIEEAVKRLARQKRAADAYMAGMGSSEGYGVRPDEVYLDYAAQDAERCKRTGGAILSVQLADEIQVGRFSTIVGNLFSQRREQ